MRQEISINIVREDNNTITHHKVAAPSYASSQNKKPSSPLAPIDQHQPHQPQNSTSNTPNIHTPHTGAVSPSSPSQPISVVVLPNPTVTRSRLLMAAIQILPGGFRCRRWVWLGWTGWVVRTLGPQESGLTFNHILSQCRVSCIGISRRS